MRRPKDHERAPTTRPPRPAIRETATGAPAPAPPRGAPTMRIARDRKLAAAAAALLTAAACMGKKADRSAGAPEAMSNQTAPGRAGDGDLAEVSATMAMEAPKRDEAGKNAADDLPAAPPAEDGKLGKRANRPEGLTRAWFPETFLFEPLIITDDAGVASVTARVPDRLTSWRVLALAHSRSGAQGGAVTSFLGTLPTYVDPIVPKVLVVGDELRLPIQLVNTTSAAVATTLSLEVDANATISGPAGPVTIAANSSRVEYARLVATHAGAVALRVTLGDRDAVLRTITVVPAGQPLTTTRSGTLAAPRTLTLGGVPGADPATDRVRLLAFPGALALLRSELAVATSRAEVADDAYALLLAGRATELLTSLGGEADPEAVRELSLLTGQRAVRDARTLDVATATLMTEAALAHANNPVLQRLGTRAAEYLASHQRPDGTFAGGDGWPLQRVLVATAEATRAVSSATATDADRKRATAVGVRAAGAFERNALHVVDGYTAAAILASGAATGKLAEELRTKVRGAIKTVDDGAKILEVADDVVRADGTSPSTLEATALAVLALQGDPQAPLADLGAALLGGYGFARGWGDGRTNLLAMRAVLELFKAPAPPDVTIQLLMDGKPVLQGVLTKDKRHEVLILEGPAPGLATAHEWKLVADPPVPGLGYSLALQSWVPWQKSAPRRGLELQLEPVLRGAVGKPIPLAITAVAPSGMALHLQVALPAGVQLEPSELQALVDGHAIERFTTADGTLDLYLRPLAPGQVFATQLRAIPTLAGTLHTTAAMIEAGADRFHVPPTTWVIK